MTNGTSGTDVWAALSARTTARNGNVYRAELSDIALAVRQGAAGLVLCAETNDSPRPVACIDLARRVIAAEYDDE